MQDLRSVRFSQVLTLTRCNAGQKFPIGKPLLIPSAEVLSLSGNHLRKITRRTSENGLLAADRPKRNTVRRRIVATGWLVLVATQHLSFDAATLDFSVERECSV